MGKGGARLLFAGVVLALAACTEGRTAGGGGHGAAGDYCAIGSASSLFLIDRTSVFDAQDRAVVMESLGTVMDRLGTGDRIVIATISDHYAKSQSLVNACKPGCPPSTGTLDGIIGSCSTMLAEADARAFTGNLAGALQGVIAGAEDAPGSDIVRTVAQWTKSPPGARDFSTVYVFSDMLENSDMLPYRTFRDGTPEESLATAARFEVLPNVPGGRVRIVGFGRGHGADRAPLPAELDLKFRKFWTDYFSAGGGSVTFEGAIRD